ARSGEGRTLAAQGRIGAAPYPPAPCPLRGQGEQDEGGGEHKVRPCQVSKVGRTLCSPYPTPRSSLFSFHKGSEMMRADHLSAPLPHPGERAGERGLRAKRMGCGVIA